MQIQELIDEIELHDGSVHEILAEHLRDLKGILDLDEYTEAIDEFIELSAEKE